MKTILVVDPFHSGEYLVNKLEKLGFDVLTLRTLDVKSTYFDDDFLYSDKTLQSTGDIEKDIEAIRARTAGNELIHGIAGSEASLLYADQLLYRLFPSRWNNPESTALRFRKSAMQQRLKSQHLKAIEGHLLKDTVSPEEKRQQALAFYHEHGPEIVMKPDNSVCSAGFRMIHDEAGVVDYLAHQQDVPLFECADTLLQRVVRGTHYYANTVSCNGVHRICAIGRSVKQLNNGKVKELYKELVDFDHTAESDSRSISGFILSVLETLEVGFGFSHIEFVEAEDGYYLIELNPRISGLHGALNRMTAAKYAKDQVDVYGEFLDQYCDLEKGLSDSHQILRTIYLYNLNHAKYCSLLPILDKLSSVYFYEKLKLSEHTDCSSLMDVSMVAILSAANEETLDLEANQLFGMINAQ